MLAETFLDKIVFENNSNLRLLFLDASKGSLGLCTKWSFVKCKTHHHAFYLELDKDIFAFIDLLKDHHHLKNFLSN